MCSLESSWRREVLPFTHPFPSSLGWWCFPNLPPLSFRVVPHLEECCVSPSCVGWCLLLMGEGACSFLPLVGGSLLVLSGDAAFLFLLWICCRYRLILEWCCGAPALVGSGAPPPSGKCCFLLLQKETKSGRAIQLNYRVSPVNTYRTTHMMRRESTTQMEEEGQQHHPRRRRAGGWVEREGRKDVVVSIGVGNLASVCSVLRCLATSKCYNIQTSYIYHIQNRFSKK